ncbi:MAG: MarR family transcriptional regulator [Eggerthellaceae bacterium]|nr:MarR family transcriptional regulator [Eggerthellaceae bacterium]
MDKLRHREYIGFQVYMAQKALARSLDLTLAPFGLTSGQWNIMNQLEENGAMSQRELADYVRKEPATVARMLDRLVSRGLVKRTASPHDRRANIIENTPEATALLQEIDPVVSARSDQLAAGISDADLAVFFDVLQQVRKNAQATTGPEA